MTFTEYFENPINQGLLKSNLTLYFLPGQHILEAHHYSLANVSNVKLLGMPMNERKVDVICNGDGELSFIEIQNLKLEALQFLSCNSKGGAIAVFDSDVCEVIDIRLFNSSLYLHSIVHLTAENTVISNANSQESLMKIQNCTGIISNLTVDNNKVTASTAGKVVSITHTSLHIKGSINFMNNSCTLTTLCPTLLYMRYSSVAISAHIVFSKNTYFLNLWVSSISHINLYGKLAMYLNLENVALLMIYDGTFYGYQTNVNMSHNICKGSAVSIIMSVLDLNGTTTFQSNFAGGAQLSASFKSYIIISSEASFLNNINNTDIVSGGAISLDSNSFLQTNASIVFENNSAHLGGAITVNESSINFQGTTTFINNSANEGGAIYIFNSNMSGIRICFIGKTTFNSNSATKGGAIYGFQSNLNVSFYGTTIFTNNRANLHVALFQCDNCHVNFSGHTTFEKGISLEGGIITVSGSTLLLFNGINVFAHNLALAETGNLLIRFGAEIQCHGRNRFVRNEGGVLDFKESGPFVISGTSVFKDNINRFSYGPGAIYLLHSSGTLQGYAEFVNNTGSESQVGIFGVMASSITLNGTIHFKTNSATIAGGLYVFNSNVMFFGKITFASNVAQVCGGGVVCIGSHIMFHSHSNFEKNKVQNVPGFGGAIHAVNCKIQLDGTYNFYGNKASNGGALSLLSDSKLFLKSVKIAFFNNSADLGGALYVEDTLSPSDCSKNINF